MQIALEKGNTTDAFDFLALLQETALFLWGGWSLEMRLASHGPNSFKLDGECPYCVPAKHTIFETVTEPFETVVGSGTYRVAAARCAACRQFILAIIRHDISEGYSRGEWVYFSHQPLSLPKEPVSDEIPEDVRLDFQEALRCRFVNANNATVEMCRRALESSCIQLGASQKLVLNDMIEWVHKQGKITTPLRDMAHKIKLGGNRAAHPSDRTLLPEDADAVLEFTREYFQHVYVMPAKMAKFNFDKPKESKS